MRRRINPDVLVTSAPKAEVKRYKYLDNITPFNLWFREQLEKCGGLKTFCREAKINYDTARCWTYKTNPQAYNYNVIAKYFGQKFGRPYMEIVKEIENLKRLRGTV